MASGEIGAKEGLPNWRSNFRKVCNQPLNAIRLLLQGRLVGDLIVGAEDLDKALGQVGLCVERRPSDEQIRCGGRYLDLQLYITDQIRFDNPQHRPWIDIIRFSDEGSAHALMGDLTQWYSGRSEADFRLFFTVKRDDGQDAVSLILRRGNYVINVGLAIPFRIAAMDEPSNSPEQHAYLEVSIDTLVQVLHILAAHLLEPGAIIPVPPAKPGKD